MIASATFLSLALQCAPDVHPDTLHALVRTESSFNPWAIGVVDKPLGKQPTSRDKAISEVNSLVKRGANFSIGLAQINKQHFDVKAVEDVFEPCTNLRMGARILKNCYIQALNEGESDQQTALHKAFSCYNSGNFKRGFKVDYGGSSYVQRVVQNSNVKVPAIEKEQSEPESTQPIDQSEPTYESWDVMRQYPHYGAPTDKEKKTTPNTVSKDIEKNV